MTVLNVAVLVTVGIFLVVYSSVDAVAGQSGGRKLRCIDGINTTIYYKKNSHSD